MFLVELHHTGTLVVWRIIAEKYYLFSPVRVLGVHHSDETGEEHLLKVSYSIRILQKGVLEAQPILIWSGLVGPGPARGPHNLFGLAGRCFA